jgi:hypothetical protein
MNEPVQCQHSATVTARDEFFIGWLPIPRTYIGLVRSIIGVVLVAGAGTAVALAFFQRDPGPGQWDADSVRTFDGIVFAEPYAILRVSGEKPGDFPRSMLLVEEGKFGALPRITTLLRGRTKGLPVRVSGTILQRDGRWMVEISEGEDGIRPLSVEEQRKLAPLDWPTPQVLAEHATLSGEIIDPKCYLGAMKPGGGKTHKACAMLCISGGIPPMLVTRDANGQETFYLLTTPTGDTANGLVLPFVGDQVEVTGRVERHGDLLTVTIDRDGIKRR